MEQLVFVNFQEAVLIVFNNQFNLKMVKKKKYPKINKTKNQKSCKEINMGRKILFVHE